MVIKVLNLDKCIKKFGDMRKIDISPVIMEGTAKVQGTAKKLAPVNKNPKAPTRGNLRGSIRRKTLKRIGKDGSPWAVGKVWTPVEYAIYQEFGFTVKTKTGRKAVPAQPFMIPALKKESPGIRRDIKAYMKNKMSNISQK